MSARPIAAIAMFALLAGCAAGDPAAPTSRDASARPAQHSPSQSPSPAAGSSSPTAAAIPAESLTLGPDRLAEVVTTDLVVRSAPGVSADSEIYPELLNEPTLLFVVDGPVAADGFDWYLVEPFSRNVCMDLCPARLPFGWVAQAGTDGEPWIAPGTLDCPEPDAGDIGWLSRTARLACYGNDTLVLEGTPGSCYAAETPIALLQTGCHILPVDGMEPGTLRSFLVMHPAGGVDMPMDRPGVRITVTGHFDDASSSSCQWSEGFNDAIGNPAVEPPSPQLVILGCRQAFVVTDIAVAE